MSENDQPDLSSLRIDRSRRNNDRPSSGLWRYVVVTLVLAAIVILYFSLRERVTPATKVKVATASLLTGSDAQAGLVAAGYVVAQRKAEVASKGTGRLESLGFEEGDVVRSGQVIAVLDNADIRANLEMARAALQRAQADSLNAGRNYRRVQRLFSSGSVTEEILQSAEAAYLASTATVAEATAGVKAAEVNLENTYIRAPFDGTVLTKNADVGEIVAPFASSASSKGSVVTLADMSSLEVEADVSESNIQKVRVGQRCEIVLDAYPETRYPARVKKIVPTADRARATVLTKVAFDSKDDRVLPEMSARVNFFLSEDGAKPAVSAPVITVANDAITTRDDQKVVFVVEDDHVRAAAVQTGRKLGGVTEITSGLSAGEQVVLSPAGRMQSGDKVEISQ